MDEYVDPATGRKYRLTHLGVSKVSFPLKIDGVIVAIDLVVHYANHCYTRSRRPEEGEHLVLFRERLSDGTLDERIFFLPAAMAIFERPTSHCGRTESEPQYPSPHQSTPRHSAPGKTVLRDPHPLLPSSEGNVSLGLTGKKNPPASEGFFSGTCRAAWISPVVGARKAFLAAWALP